MSFRIKKSKREHEMRIISNPLVKSQLSTVSKHDYEAPLTSNDLWPNSKWFIVRHNLHKVRSWGGIRPYDSNPVTRDWYLFFQMRKELRRVQEHIGNIQKHPHFQPVRYFYLPIDEKHQRRFNVSHVKSTDALYYSGIGKEPIVLQALLYYFSRECAVPYNSVFRSFLTDICAIIQHERQQMTRVAVFRRVAFVITIIIFLILALMFASLIVSVLNTTYEFHKLYDNDPHGGLQWQQIE